jgi:anaerobic ribonucleoside-triphosphate reductase activating protein
MMNKEEKDVRLNVAALEERSTVNGPGERFVLWVQGCPFRCQGCFNPGYLHFNERAGFGVEELVERIKNVPGIEGVTFSGGEPMAHARALYFLSRELKKSNLTIVCYSGYTLEELNQSDDPWVAHLVSCLDILIDGRYEKQQQVSLRWRGSANQRVHFLTSAYAHFAAEINERCREVELIIGENGFVTTGIFDVEFLNQLERVLNEGSDSRILKH